MLSDTAFRESRWRRAGATDEQVDELRATHADLSAEEQAAEAVRVDSVSDTDLAVELEVGTVDLTVGTVQEVLARVGQDAAAATVALSREQAKPKPRETLLEALAAVADAAQTGD